MLPLTSVVLRLQVPRGTSQHVQPQVREKPSERIGCGGSGSLLSHSCPVLGRKTQNVFFSYLSKYVPDDTGYRDKPSTPLDMSIPVALPHLFFGSVFSERLFHVCEYKGCTFRANLSPSATCTTRVFRDVLKNV